MKYLRSFRVKTCILSIVLLTGNLPVLLLAGNYLKEIKVFKGSTPVIDGKISPGEYDDATKFSGTMDWFREFSANSGPDDLSLKAWVKHDGKNLYFAFDVTDDVIYGIDIPRWLPDDAPLAHDFTVKNSLPWFGDGIEIFLNPENKWDLAGNDNTKGNGLSWQMVCSTHKSFENRLKRGGLIEGELRNEYSWANYREWIKSGAMKAAVHIKAGSEGHGYIIEWMIAPKPCLEVSPGKYWSPEQGVVRMGLNIEVQDLDEKVRGQGNFANMHHVDVWAEDPVKRGKSALKNLGTLTVYPGSRPSVLLVGNTGWCGYNIARRLNDAGFTVNGSPAIAGFGPESETLTWDKVKQYNTIIIDGLGYASGDNSLTRSNHTLIALLRRFMDAGGGVLVLPHYVQTLNQIPPQVEFLSQLGLTPLFDEIITDSESSTIATAWKIGFIHTEAISNTPITKGIKSLWYPSPGERLAWQSHSVPCRVDTTWNVAVSGSGTASTKRVPLNDETKSYEGTFKKKPPFVAIRQVGKGRMVYYGIVDNYLLNEVASTTLEGITLDRGLKGIPSDGFKLLANSLEWLADPSLEKGDLGGAAMDTRMMINPRKVDFEIRHTWSGKSVFPQAGTEKQGIIGLRSSYSTGKASVEDWVQKAKASGLSFIVFLEDFTSLSQQEFSQLRGDCKRLSTSGFLAVPGFTIDDEIGNHYFYFGTTFDYPDKRFLSADGKVFRSRSNGSDAKGQLASTTLDYTYSVNGFKLMAGNYLFHQDSAPFSDWFSNWQAMGIITSKNGVLIEDASEDYLRLNASGQDPLPLAIDLIDDPSELDSSPWRVVVRLPDRFDNPNNCVIDQRIGLEEFFNAWHFDDYYISDNPNEIYITNGPSIDYLGYSGARHYPANSNGDFLWQNYRWQIRGIVSSSAGLKSVELYDGTKLFRRFIPSGEKSYIFNLDLTHNQQHNYVLIVTDMAGKQAISRELSDHNDRCEEFMCADRNNQLTSSNVIDKNGESILMGGNQMLATPCKRTGNPISPAGAFKNDSRFGAPAFDGSAWGEPQVFENVKPSGAPGNVEMPNVVEAVRLLASGDLNIGEGRSQNIYKDSVKALHVWTTLWSTKPSESIKVTRRNSYFQIDPDSPMPVFLWQFDISLLEDLPNKGFDIAYMFPGESKLWAMHGSDLRTYCGSWEETALSLQRHLKIPFDRNSYAAFNNSPLGGTIVFPLTDGMEASLSLPQSNNIYFTLSPDASPQKRGDNVKPELLLVGIPRPTEYTAAMPAATTEIIERFCKDFGMDGGETGYTLKISTGKVTGRRYILKIDGSEDESFSGIIEGDLISSLPVAVSGLNNNWSAILYDRDLKKARPLGITNGTAWAVFPQKGSHNLFIGHPVTADNKDLIIQVTQCSESGWVVEVHNPTIGDITSLIRFNPYFDLLRAKSQEEKMTVPAGSSVILHI